MSRKMDQSKVFDFLNDVYIASFKTEKIPVSGFIRKHKLGTYVLPVLIESKILKKIKKGTYKWESIKPNMKMVEKVIEKTSQKNRLTQERYFSQLEALEVKNISIDQIENKDNVEYTTAQEPDLFSQPVKIVQIEKVQEDIKNDEKIESKPKYARQRKIEKQKSFSFLWGAINLKW